ncbi:hypothetical protein RhiirA5_356151 [Rhizophagus irregularis]|nr:hypothetical protein GLOIN_2v1642440 [Rhizophagus irregularis DAOM 181602=DAOM 197198]PKC09878.1 hypothetical protein RhiirA5_356151 [Rhizophagus irregularis]PKC65290.1 hypothetical protein RhiirA1_420630 [Rhizophagus irregularis]PKY22291.1 hypothetical protein RhiirB3_410438 [Rhizophagus irregularis]PKY41945.1 hypothetical protein RhiirA4_396679 [Rhizophagus irregularis]POG67915.1 hypothetical protein GLOIN_2v1642440 [Rhizophagus irregularis DAOM 181602=DAOM 197198]|eukprot:XP_025174781.1 hypothetical protein GLOIN_2v1642440 [Rhizophagus irregularis DAOM 181602=DAOM 197198]
MWLTASIVGGATLYSFTKSQVQRTGFQYDLSSHSNGNIENLRSEWKKQNNGIGLKDVTRSCGGV